MKAPDLYLAGKRIDLLNRIGKGGEGEVWLIADDPKQAVKFYTVPDLASRETKVRAMTRLGLADAYRLVSYPREVVTTRSGQFAGFTMSLVGSARQVHELYGVKSRKIHYPNKDYRFLIRAAANTARAVAQVHASPCVIGDLNQSGILVANDATVALIDADSFQLQSEGITYPCLVGVPEFTPPELQGKSLTNVIRTKLHDQFGLSVAIFQLLCMGRHPYAGRCDIDLTLDQFIARNLFAYSLLRSNGVTPPAGTVTLDAFPSEIASAFEHSFGSDPHQRPTAADWVTNLEKLESQLSHCTTDSSHYFPTSVKVCPWCKMEASSGAILFLQNFGLSTPRAIDLGTFDVEKIWAAIRVFVVPDASDLSPPLPPLPKDPSQVARDARRSSMLPKWGGIALSLVMIALWINTPNLIFLWIGGIIAAIYIYNRKGFEGSEWQRRYSEADRRYDESLALWRARLGHTQMVALRAELENAVTEYKGLPSAKTKALDKLKTDRQRRQLHDHLDRFLIQRASIPSIGPAKTSTLRSFGVESAADIDPHKIIQIPGFGPATADKLVAWRLNLERRFTYNPMRTSADAAAESRIESEFNAKRSSLAKKIGGGHAEFSQIAAAMHRRRHLEDPRIAELAKVRAQLSADLSHLKVSKPSARVPTPMTSPVARKTTISAANPSRVTCPSCGSTMVRRTARRGSRRGNTFWGCSRYPQCRGTRP